MVSDTNIEVMNSEQLGGHNSNAYFVFQCLLHRPVPVLQKLLVPAGKFWLKHLFSADSQISQLSLTLLGKWSRVCHVI